MLSDRVNKIISGTWLLPVYAVLMYTFWLPGYAKIFDRDQSIPNYEETFAESFFGRSGLTNPLITLIGAVELVIVVLAAVSLLRMEFRPGKTAPFLQLALWLGSATFAMLGFGLRMIQNNTGAAQLYYYFVLTVGLLVVVHIRDRRVATEVSSTDAPS